MKFKKNIVYAFLLFLLIILIISISYARESIVDYYNLIPIKLLDEYRYQLQFKNNNWITRSNANYEIRPIVDIKNGYLKIKDAGTGGGAVEHELVLYRTPEGNDIIGVNITQFDGLGHICKLRFYKPAENQWMDITNDVLPKVDLSRFMDDNTKLNMEKFSKLIEGIEFLYRLPRIGTTMNVKIELDRFIMIHSENGKKPMSGVKEIINNIKYQEIKLIWDKKNSKFNFGEKTLFMPSDVIKNYLK